MLKFLSISFVLIFQVISQRIEKDIKDYFESKFVKKCEDTWSKYRLGFEDSLSKALSGYGRETMNLYIKRSPDSLLLTDGYYHTDNQVEMLFQEMLLEELPRLIDPELEFNLCANVMKINSIISPMIIHTPYMLFRNKSDIMFSLDDQKTKNSSPMRFEQVRNIGSMTITAENCFLTGQVLTALDGRSVTVRHDSLDIKSCEFEIEVYVPGQRTPPVMANYLFDDNGFKLQDLITRLINKELMPQMQAAMFAFINASSIFGADLLNFEKEQKVLWSKTEGYMTHVVREINTYLIENDLGSVQLRDFQIRWNESFNGENKNCAIKLTNMTLSGVESAYTAHVGGPMKLDSVQIMEQVKLSSIQVTGKIILEGMDDSEHRFAADIYDAAIDVILNVNALEEKLKATRDNENYDDNGGHVFKFVGWRRMDFSSPDIEYLPIESIVTGYLLTELPYYIAHPLKTAFKSAIKNTIIDNGEDYAEKGEPVVEDSDNELNEYSEENENIEESHHSEGSEPENIDENTVAESSKRKRHHKR